MRKGFTFGLTPLGVGLVLSLVTIASFVMSYTVMASTAGSMPQHLIESQFDGWSYTIITDPDGSVFAYVDYDRTTVAALYRYAETNRTLARQLAADGQEVLSVSISFRRPLLIDEFRTWAARVPLRIKDYQFRAVGSDGRSWTLGAAPSHGELVYMPDLQLTLDHLAARGRSITEVRGVIIVDGQIDISAYEQLATDPFIFLADVTRSAVVTHVAKTVRGIDYRRLAVLAPPAFAAMEKLGLESFQ